MDDVDFTVTSSDDGVDEDLPQPESRARSPLQRAVVGLITLAAVIGIGIAISASRHGRPLAAPTTSAAPSERFTVVPQRRITRFTPPPDVIMIDANSGAVVCPRAGDGQSACLTSHLVPPAVVAALRAHFPGARVLRETDDILRDTGLGSNGIWDRRISAVAGPIRITVLVRRPLPEDVTVGDTAHVGNRTVETESTGSGGFTVTVTVDAPSTHPSVSGAVDLLVSDQRLLIRP